MNKNKISVIAALVLGVAAFFSVRSCSGDSEITIPLPPNIIAVADTVYVSDTIVVVEVEYDTIYQQIFTTLEPVKPKDPDTTYLEYDPILSEYTGTQSDSLVDINFKILSTGELNEVVLSYKLNSPIYTEKTIYRTVIKEVQRRGFYVGGGLRYEPANNQIYYFAQSSYLFGKGWQVSYTYEPPTKSHGVLFQKRIF